MKFSLPISTEWKDCLGVPFLVLIIVKQYPLDIEFDDIRKMFSFNCLSKEEFNLELNAHQTE